MLVPGCFISTTLLSSSIAETSSSTEAKNGSACLPTDRWLEARVLLCNIFLLSPALSHGRKQPIYTAQFLHCPSFLRKSTRNPPLRCCNVGSEFVWSCWGKLKLRIFKRQGSLVMSHRWILLSGDGILMENFVCILHALYYFASWDWAVIIDTWHCFLCNLQKIDNFLTWN